MPLYILANVDATFISMSDDFILFFASRGMYSSYVRVNEKLHIVNKEVCSSKT